MRIIVDTNIVFSAIINTNSLISRILLQPKSRLNFYSSDLLLIEIEEHKEKLKKISKLSDEELNISIRLITSKIRFIEAKLIPPQVYESAENILRDIDIDDTEFVALTNHLHGKLWSGDKILQKGLHQKGWQKFISTNELTQVIKRRK